MGLCKGIGSISREKEWAHSWPSAAFFGSNNGPMQGYWWCCLGETVNPFKDSAAFFRRNSGPMQGYRQHFLVETLGPFVAICSNFFGSDNGPMQGYRQHFLVF